MTAPLDLRAKLGAQLEVPVVRAGLALVSSAGITSVLGLAYWSLAARNYSPAALGAAAALLAAMDVIAAVANLGLKTALIRFVPALGPAASRVVAASYLASGTVALAGGAVFVAVHARWFPELTLLDHGPGIAFFLVSTVLWVVFFLQDSVLVGLRRAAWVPVENTLFAVAKLALLLFLVTPMPGWGIYVSWVAPVFLVVLGVNLPVFGLLRRGTGQAAERLTLRDLVRFSAGDYAASTIWLVTIGALPLLVLALTTAEDTSWYHLSWTIAYTLYLITSAVGSALVAEGAHDPGGLDRHARRAAGQALFFVLPAATVVVVGAPWLLQLFGKQYASEASTLLRLVAASAVPHVVTGIYVNLQRARRQIRSVVAVYALLAAGVVGLSVVLVPRIGVTGAGVAWFCTQIVLAVGLLATRLQSLWVGALPTPLIRALGTPGRWRTAARQRRRAAALVAELDLAGASDGTWSVLHATEDFVVVAVGSPSGPAVLKLPGSHEAELARRRELTALQALASEPALATWSTCVPRPIAHGADGHQAWTTETRLPGRRGDEALRSGVGPDVLLQRGVAALAGLHQPTARPVVVGEALLRSWVDDPVLVVARACPEALPALAEIAATLRLALVDRALTVAWSHGDATPGNLLVDDDGTVTGIVDWEGARADRLPELDLVTLIAGVRASTRTEELGETTVALLRRPWTEEEVAALATGPNADLPRSAVVLLGWLHHVATNLTKSQAYAHHRVWLVRNVLPVTETVLAPEPSAPVVTAPDRATPPVPTTRRFTPTAPWWPFAVPLAGVLAWFGGWWDLDARDLGDLGLVSQLSPLSAVGLGVLLVGLAVTVTRSRVREGLAAAHLAGLVTVLFATPAVLYPTLRYSWTWKHLGIVDYIDRFGGVDPGIDVLPVYHNWPGFFAGSHLLQDLVGADNALLIARWSPLALSLATVAAVALLAATFSPDRRVVWLTAGVFTVANWVGQEYFSPQALTYLLYLVALALTLRLSRAGREGAATVVMVVALAVAVAISHQLTPAMLTVALVALACTRRPRVLALAVIAAVSTLTWAFWAASTYTGQNLRDVLEGFGQPLANVEGNLTRGLSDAQALVALAGRGLVLLIGLLAIVGLIRSWRAGRRDRAPVALMVAPVVLLAANDFDGEILFRVYLYALPFAAFYAAQSLLDLPGLRSRWAAALVPTVVLGLLTGGFLLAHFGKDGHYVFTPEEVDAATWVYEQAPDGSLLIEGSRNYPTQFLGYEQLRYVPLDREDLAARREIARRPVQTLTRWMADEDDPAAYLLLTRSQRLEAEALGLRPVDFLERLEDDLRSSGRFAVAFENRDAVVFTLANRERWQ